MKFFVVILNPLIHTGVSRKNNLQRKKRSKFRGPQASGRPCMRNAPFPQQGDPCSAATPSSLCRLPSLSRPIWQFAWHVYPPQRAQLSRQFAHGKRFQICSCACDAHWHPSSKTQREHAKCPSRCQSHHVLSPTPACTGYANGPFCVVVFYGERINSTVAQRREFQHGALAAQSQAENKQTTDQDDILKKLWKRLENSSQQHKCRTCFHMLPCRGGLAPFFYSR